MANKSYALNQNAKLLIIFEIFNAILDSARYSVSRQLMSDENQADTAMLPYGLVEFLVAIKTADGGRPIANLVNFLF